MMSVDVEETRKSRPVAVMTLMVLETVLAFLGFVSGFTFLLDPSGVTHGMDTTMLLTTPIRDVAPVGLLVTNQLQISLNSP